MCTAAALVGCRDDPAPKGAVAPLGRKAPAQAAPPPETAAHAYPARRCGECHAKAMQTWEDSAHARADSSPTYRAMRAASGRTDCDRCHAPLRGRMGGDESVASEGVTCDVCHTLRSVEPDAHASTALELDVAGAARYGPLCELDDHYFHKMGCSPLHARAELCGACHDWTTHTPGMKELDVLTTYTDWRAGPYAEAEVDQPCQGCHMSALAGEVAVGWGSRASASDHGNFGPGDELRSRAIALELQVEATERELELELEVVNAGAGHPLPGGLPGRRIVVRASTFAADGAEIAHEERTYGRILVDASGAEVPFYAAARVQADTRLMADEHRREHFSFASAGVREIRVEAFAHPLSPSIAKAIGVTAPTPIRLTSARATKQARGNWENEAP